MMPTTKLILFAVAMTQVLACGGPDCRSTCERLYSSGTDASGETQCNIRGPNGDQYDRCLSECNRAMETVGELGTYNPQEKPDPNEIPELKNDQQAAAWMDCIADASCELLTKQSVCAPVWK